MRMGRQEMLIDPQMCLVNVDTISPPESDGIMDIADVTQINRGRGVASSVCVSAATSDAERRRATWLTE